ncbi:MAG: peptidylprolyl isomerase [Anaerolineales bacterium]|jgi:parvulin-like peptidyl-prolyl isomerase
MAKNKSPKVLTKKHLARQERERRQTRLITGIAIGIIAIVVLGIAYGLLNDTLFLNWRPAVTVNGESRSLHEFQAQVKVERQQLISQYMQYTQMAAMFGIDPTTDPQLSQTMTNITDELNTPSVLGSQAMDNMVHDLLIRQYAKANGITVSTADVEKSAEEALQFYQNGTPTPTLTPTQLVFSTLDATQFALVTPTLTPTTAPTNTLAPTATPNLTSTSTPIPSPTPIPSLTPTDTPYTLKGYQSQYHTTSQTYTALGLSDADFRYIFFESVLYQQRVEAKVTANVNHTQEQVWARIIEVPDETTAKTALAQLMTPGGDFAALAAKDSIDTGTKSNGGDLGWFGRDSTTVPSEIMATAFSLKIGQTSQPIKSTSGYYIIQILGHEVRPLTDQQYQTEVGNAFTTWLTQQRDKSKVVINNSYSNYVPTTPTLAQAQADNNATSTAYVSTAQAQSTP